MKKIFITLVALLFVIPCVASNVDDPKREISMLRKKLASTKSRKDSIKLLYDILDLSRREEILAVGKELDGVAAREKNLPVRFDVARLMSNSTTSDSILKSIYDHVSSLPKNKEQMETKLFIKYRRVALKARYLPEDERQKMIAKIVTMNDYDTLDNYHRIARLAAIIEYLSTYSRGELLVQYLDDLMKLIKRSNIESYAVYNMFFTEAANIYTAAGLHQKALETDRKLLEIIENLEKTYAAQGRKYRNYDASRYLVYRRMLSNYPALSVKEVNDLYSKILALSKSSRTVREDLDIHKRTAAYHAMKNKRYAEAIPYIKSELKVEKSITLKRQLLEMLIEAADAVGDTASAQSARSQYAEIKKEMEDLSAAERYNELCIRYDVSVLRSKNDRLKIEKQNQEIASSRRLMIFVMVGWAALAIVLIIGLFYWSRYRHTLSDVRKFVRSLEKERDEIKRRRYGNIKGDPGKMSAPKGVPLDNSHVDDKNLRSMLNYVLNDVMYIASMAYEDKSKYVKDISALGFFDERKAELEANLTKNVTLNLVAPEKDFRIRTDAECLGYLVRHILKVAVRYAPSGGTVGFECSLDEQNDSACFIFTHSGPSLPTGREEKIFAQFTSFREMGKDGEAALMLCRMVDFLSNCLLRSDTHSEHQGKLTLLVPLGSIPQKLLM